MTYECYVQPITDCIISMHNIPQYANNDTHDFTVKKACPVIVQTKLSKINSKLTCRSASFWYFIWSHNLYLQARFPSGVLLMCVREIFGCILGLGIVPSASMSPLICLYC